MLNPDQPVLGQKYRLIRQLEVGGMGSVWVAEHVHLNSLVAVKLIAREVAATPAGKERFLREARTAASLRSPHVVQILDYGLHDGMPFIAMELLEGESLAARLDRDGAFASWEHAERVLRYVARAVGRAHAAGIIHRDLKPANIFLVRDEEEEIVKLLDFGIAKTTATPLSAEPSNGTRTGEFLGSPTYASPEQLQASKKLDHRADIWSLGVIAYECFLGRPPFAAETLVNLVLAICMEPLPVPSEHGLVPDGFDTWFARACARDAEQRFTSVREASAELRRLVAAACGSRLSQSELESSSASDWERMPPSLPESVPGVQTPPSAPATLLQAAPPRSTLLQAAFSAPASARGGTALARRSETTRADLEPRHVQVRPRRSRASWVAALALIALVPLLLFALRALASRAFLDERVLGLGAAEPIEPAPGVIPTPRDVPEHGTEPAHAVSLPAPSEGPSAGVVPPGADAPASDTVATPSAAQPDAVQPDTSQPDTSQPGTLEPSRSPEQPKVSSTQAHAEKRKAPRARGAATRARQAWLTITASAPSIVLVDGAPIGKTPLEGVAIEAGEHEITFVRDGERKTQTVELRAGEHKRIDARPEPARGDGLDEVAVQRTVRRHSATVREDCWDRALGARPPGDHRSLRVTATITVEPSGRVRSVVTNGAPAAYGDLSRCIEQQVSSWRFPSARGETVVNVPFVFVTE